MIPVSRWTSVSVADLAHDVGQEVERDRGAVELTAAVVGQQHGVDAEVGGPAASSTDWTPLTTNLPGHCSRIQARSS